MKKIISTLIAGLLVFSSVSAFAEYTFDESISSTDYGYLLRNNVTTPTGDIPNCMGGWAFEDNKKDGEVFMTVVAGDGDGQPYPSTCLDVASTKKGPLLKNSVGNTNQPHIRYTTAIQIKSDAGLRIQWQENANDGWRTRKDVLEFSTGGKIVAYGSTSSVNATWSKGAWYILSIVYERNTSTEGATYVAELKNVWGKLLYTWIGKTGSANTAPTKGLAQIIFAPQGATEFSLDDTKWGRGCGGTSWSDPNKDVNAPYEVTRQCFVADKAVVTDLASMQGKEVSAEFSVKDTSITATTPKLVIAAYDKDGRLQAANMCDIKLDDANLVSTAINVPADAASVKMFTWDFGAGLTPLLDPVVVEAAE